MIPFNLCRCGHDERVHDPCSICFCPGFEDGKAKKYPVRGQLSKAQIREQVAIRRQMAKEADR